jgi:hypothetical protein
MLSRSKRRENSPGNINQSAMSGGCRPKFAISDRGTLYSLVGFAIYCDRDGGTEEVSVPLVRDLHPEFGYLGSFHLFGRKLGLVLVFIGFGVMAGMSGLAVFMTDGEPDPMQAMALAPPDAMSRDSGLVMPAPVDASVPLEPAQTPAQTKTFRPACPEGVAVDCAIPAGPKVHRPKLAPAINERPSIAAVPIGRVDPSQVLPAEATPTPPSAEPVPVAAVPEPADVSTQPAEAAPAPVPPPAVKRPPRQRIEHVEHRERSREQPSHRGNFGSPVWAGYARVY